MGRLINISQPPVPYVRYVRASLYLILISHSRSSSNFNILAYVLTSAPTLSRILVPLLDFEILLSGFYPGPPLQQFFYWNILGDSRCQRISSTSLPGSQGSSRPFQHNCTCPARGSPQYFDSNFLSIFISCSHHISVPQPFHRHFKPFLSFPFVPIGPNLRALG